MRGTGISSTGRIIKKYMIGIAFLWGLLFPQVCYANFLSESPFEGASWELVHQEPLISSSGIVQSVCCTDNYIICLENVDDDPSVPDRISAYYKNSTDENGNPVEQYTLAKSLLETNYEHANGMTFNPNTNEIYVSLYNDFNPDNRGCIFVVDPDTLAYKGKIQIATDYNILGIGYKKDTDQYIIQTNVEGGYSFKILDSNFQIVEDLGEYDGTAKGSNFQDLCVDGDYIINFPLTLGYGIGDFINVYSISQRRLLSESQFSIDTQGAASDEPESICETAPGEFLAVVQIVMSKTESITNFYKTSVPYSFNINANAEKYGSVSVDKSTIARGDNCTLTFSHDEYYEIDTLTINGKQEDISPSSTTYTLSNIQSDASIDVTYKKMNFFTRLEHLTTRIVEKGLERRITYQAQLAQKNAYNDSSTTASRPKTGLLKWILLIIVIILGFSAFYLRILYVRRVRYIKQLRARREWERAKRIQQERDEWESETI